VNSNIVEFLKTRKFWSPIIALVMTLLVPAAKEFFNLEMSPDLQMLITTFLWSIAGIVVYGDAKYDWTTAQKSDTTIEVENVESAVVSNNTPTQG
jgi:hypothetical protein